MWNRVGSLAIVVVTIGSAALAGCGGGDSQNALPVERVEAFASPYCVTARSWAVHELDGGGDGAYARGGPAGLRTWWKEQLAYLETSLDQAPPEVRTAEALNERVIRTRLTPLLEKYGFDFQRVQTEATLAERALMEHPPAEIAKAQETRNLYQNRNCGYGGPPHADVTFAKSAAAGPYCEAVAAQRRGFGEVATAGFDPGKLESYLTSQDFRAALDAQDELAPAEIASDVEADNEWVRTRKLDIAERYDYDLRRLMLEGSAEELFAWTYWDPAIVVQDGRVTTYQEQVCGR